MIKKHCFEKPWIDGFKTQKEYSKINPPVLEKMIHALCLLQHLKKQGFNFIFKGGTSLILILEKANRFSVDIDIITTHTREEVEVILDKVVANSHFKKWALDEKRSYKEGVPKAHYELEYDSNINKSSNYILLDILFEDSHYPKLQERLIHAHWIEIEEEIIALVPTVEAITGDKLTAFAPNTTGIPYDKGKELEIIKQLFDLSNLYDKIEDVKVTAESFGAFAKQEIRYRSLEITSEDVLWDVIKTCKVISLRERNREEPQKSQFKELQNGIRSFSNFLISGNFRIEDAVTASSKVAYLAAKLLTGNNNPLVRYNGESIADMDINNQQWNGLNALKKLPDKSAFFYWYQTLSLLNLIEEPQQV